MLPVNKNLPDTANKKPPRLPVARKVFARE